MEDDAALVERLQTGDENAFAELVRRYQTPLLRVAEATVGSRAVAEEACQDAWLAVVRGIERFEGRSSFKTWLFRVLVNRAHTSATQEHRAGRVDGDVIERFDASGGWADPPAPWSERVDDEVVAQQLAKRVHELLPSLPDQQRQVVVLRDVEGLEPSQVTAVLGISDGNQRVLLHRGRARLRELLALEIERDR